jgi:hypothetical protein
MTQTNVSKPDHIKKAESKERRGRERELDDMAWVLSTPQGRRFVWRYLGECGVFRTSFNGQFQTFFNEGSRNIGLKLLADVNDSQPEAYVTMMKEARKDENT